MDLTGQTVTGVYQNPQSAGQQSMDSGSAAVVAYLAAAAAAFAGTGPAATTGVNSRRVRQAFQTVPAGTNATVAVTWATPFADANYTVATAAVESSSGPWGVTMIAGSRTATGCSFQVYNLTGLLLGLLGAPLSGTLHVHAIHD